MFKVNNKTTRTPFSSASAVDFEQVSLVALIRSEFY